MIKTTKPKKSIINIKDRNGCVKKIGKPFGENVLTPFSMINIGFSSF